MKFPYCTSLSFRAIESHLFFIIWSNSTRARLNQTVSDKRSNHKSFESQYYVLHTSTPHQATWVPVRRPSPANEDWVIFDTIQWINYNSGNGKEMNINTFEEHQWHQLGLEVWNHRLAHPPSQDILPTEHHNLTQELDASGNWEVEKTARIDTDQQHAGGRLEIL